MRVFDLDPQSVASVNIDGAPGLSSNLIIKLHAMSLNTWFYKKLIDIQPHSSKNNIKINLYIDYSNMFLKTFCLVKFLLVRGNIYNWLWKSINYIIYLHSTFRNLWVSRRLSCRCDEKALSLNFIIIKLYTLFSKVYMANSWYVSISFKAKKLSSQYYPYCIKHKILCLRMHFENY